MFTVASAQEKRSSTVRIAGPKENALLSAL